MQKKDLIEEGIKRGLIAFDENKEFITYLYQNKKRKNIKKYAQVVSFEEIKQNEYNLNISRYVDSLEEEEIDLESTKQEIQKLELELKNTQNEVNKYLNELEL